MEDQEISEIISQLNAKPDKSNCQSDKNLKRLFDCLSSSQLKIKFLSFGIHEPLTEFFQTNIDLYFSEEHSDKKASELNIKLLTKIITDLSEMTDHSYYLGLNTFTLLFAFLSEILQKPIDQITKFDFCMIENFSTILAKIFQNELFFGEFLTQTKRRAAPEQPSQLEQILTLMQGTISLLNSTLFDPNQTQTFVDPSDSTHRQALTLTKSNFYLIFLRFFSTQTPIKLTTATPALHQFFFSSLFRTSLSNPGDLTLILRIYQDFLSKITSDLSKAPTYTQPPPLSQTLLSSFKSILRNLYSL